MSVEAIVLLMGSIGTIAFSISGSLIAIEKRMDIIGVLILGFVNACGGGFLRDAVIGDEILMFKDPVFPILAFSVSLAVFLLLYFLKNLDFIHSRYYKITHLTIEAIGLGAFVISGAEVAIANNYHTLFSIVFFSVLSGCGGGLVRDICSMRIPLIFRNGVFLLSGLVGSLTFMLMLYLEAPVYVSATLPVIIVVMLRILGFTFKIKLPSVDLIEDAD